MISFPRQVFDDPRLMPELRRGLIELARPNSEWAQAEHYRTFNDLAGNHKGIGTLDAELYADGTRVITGPRGLSADDLPRAIESAAIRTDNAMNWVRTALDRAQLVYVTRELCDVVFSAHDSVPDDTVFTESMPTTPFGLVLFQEPFVGIDSGDKYDEVRVDAILWGPVRLPPKHEYVFGVEGALPGFAMAALRWMHPGVHDDPAAQSLYQQSIEHGLSTQPAWVPLGRSDWVLGDVLTDVTHEGIDPNGRAHLSMIEDRKLMAALWSLISEKRMTERTTVTPQRHSNRRLDRKGDSSPREVEVVHLRRPEYRPTENPGGGRTYQHRWAVRPHWRNQACGPNRSQRKLILVPPHIKGPPDAPMLHAERVWSVDR